MAREFLVSLSTAALALAIVLSKSVCAHASDGVASDDLSVRPTKLWKFLNDNEETVLQRFRETIDEFSVGRIKCLRYCIQSRTLADQAPHVLHLIWKLDRQKSEMGSTSISDKDHTPEVLEGKSFETVDLKNSERECTFSIVIGCEIPREQEGAFSESEKKFIKNLQPNLDIFEGSTDNDSPALNFVNEKIVDRSNLTNFTETAFSIQPNQAEMSIAIFGDISKIDLKMPIAEATAQKAPPRLTLATARMPGSAALRLNVLNPPPGGWRLGLAAADDQAYRLLVTSAVVPEFAIAEDRPIGQRTGILAANEGYPDEGTKGHPAAGSTRRMSLLDGNIDRVDEMAEDDRTSHKFSARMISDDYASDMQSDEGSVRFPSSGTEFEIVDPRDNNVTSRISNDGIEDRMLDRQLVDNSNAILYEELPMRRLLLVEVNPASSLVANPNSPNEILFDVTNNNVFAVRHYFHATSSPYRLVVPPPPNLALAPGQTVTIRMPIEVPPFVNNPIVNKLTLRVQGLEVVEKSANVQIRPSGSRLNDDARPTIYYYFNNNCAGKTSAEKCLKSYWSVDVTVQDSESGLKSVTSAPRGVYPRSQYTSGTTSPVYFYYSSNCCNRVIEVAAVDVAGNVYSREIDVGEWTNLSAGEIVAIVLGILLVIALIALLAIAIVYCYRRRKSHDLSYSQRYGSRSSPRAES